MKARILTLIVSLLITTNVFSQDPNFHIYLCFGQSNMEGQGTIEAQDNTVNSRFKVMEAVNCSNLGRVKGSWYTAVPPLCRCYTKLSPSDYFGRTMVANLPDSITVGVINVSVSGCNIGLFDKVDYTDHDSTYTAAWFQNILAEYGGNPYAYLIDLAQTAQQDGVIKGILLHQGETNTGDSQWPSKVQAIYNDMLADLSLSANNVPLLAGELVSAVQGGCCSSMNSIINTLPTTIPTAHVISSSGCTDQPDNAHFDSPGYRKIGRRYAVKMLSLLGYKAVYAEAECGTYGTNWIAEADNNASNASYITAASGVENKTQAPANDSDALQMDFTVSTDSSYYVYGRFKNPTGNIDSCWVKIDNGTYELYDNLTTSGWQWLEINSANLTAGTHTIHIAINEPEVLLDKLVIKNSQIAPVDIAEEASSICVPVISGVNKNQSVAGYALEQNYPNPLTTSTSIPFEIQSATFVSLKIFDSKGVEIAELAGKKFNAGKHTLKYNLEKLPAGEYYYTIKADQFSETKKMVLNAE